MVIVVVTACGGSGADKSPADSAPTSSVAPKKLTADTGSPVLDQCIEVLVEATAGIALDEPESMDLMRTTVRAEPVTSVCSFIWDDDPEPAVGLPAGVILAALEAHLPPALMEVLSEPIPVPFDYVGDDL